MSQQEGRISTWNIKTSGNISLIVLPLFTFLSWSARSFACFSASVCRLSFVNASCICSARAFSFLRAADNSSIVSRSLSAEENNNTDVKFWSWFRKRNAVNLSTGLFMELYCRECLVIWWSHAQTIYPTTIKIYVVLASSKFNVSGALATGSANWLSSVSWDC